MPARTQYQQDKLHIEQETNAEIAFGILLEQAGVDFDAFMQEWSISHNQFNCISHYLYGLAEELPELPPALAVLLLVAGRRILLWSDFTRLCV